MNKLLSTIAVLVTVSLISCQSNQLSSETDDCPSIAASDMSHKDGVFTPDELILAGAHLVNHPVMVSGTITDVCKYGGKKCTLSGHQSNSFIQVMADGSIEQFTNDMVGTNIQVKGIVRERRVTKEMIAEEELTLKENLHSSSIEKDMKDHCKTSMADLNEMKSWMAQHQSDFYPIYYVMANSYVVIN